LLRKHYGHHLLTENKKIMETLVKNSTTVARIYEAFGKADIPFIVKQLDKNVLWNVMGAKPNIIGGVYKGAAEVPRFFEALAANYQLENFQVYYIVDCNDDTVIARGHHGGKGMKTGKPFETHWTMEWKFNEDGKVIAYQSIYDTQAYANVM
jgi:uncharacterized protein